MTHWQDKLHEAIVNLTKQKVETNKRITEPNVHAPADTADILIAEKLILADEGVQEALAKLELPEGTVIVCDPWTYGVLPPSGR